MQVWYTWQERDNKGDRYTPWDEEGLKAQCSCASYCFYCVPACFGGGGGGGVGAWADLWKVKGGSSASGWRGSGVFGGERPWSAVHRALTSIWFLPPGAACLTLLRWVVSKQHNILWGVSSEQASLVRRSTTKILLNISVVDLNSYACTVTLKLYLLIYNSNIPGHRVQSRHIPFSYCHQRCYFKPLFCEWQEILALSHLLLTSITWKENHI